MHELNSANSKVVVCFWVLFFLVIYHIFHIMVSDADSSKQQYLQLKQLKAN